MLSKKEVEIYKIDLEKLYTTIKKLERVKSYLYKRERISKSENILYYFKQYESEYPGIKIVDTKTIGRLCEASFHIYFYHLHIYSIYVGDNSFSIERELYDIIVGKDEVIDAINFVGEKFKNSDGYIKRKNDGNIKHKEIEDKYNTYYSFIDSRLEKLENGMLSMLLKIKNDIDEINSTLGTIFLANRSQDEIPLFCLIRKNKLITDIYSSIKKDDIKINKIKILSATSKMFNLEMTSDTNVYIKRIKKEKITDIIPNNSWYKWSNDEENDLLNIANKYSNMFCHTTMSFLINL